MLLANSLRILSLALNLTEFFIVCRLLWKTAIEEFKTVKNPSSEKVLKTLISRKLRARWWQWNIQRYETCLAHLQNTWLMCVIIEYGYKSLVSNPKIIDQSIGWNKVTTKVICVCFVIHEALTLIIKLSSAIQMLIASIARVFLSYFTKNCTARIFECAFLIVIVSTRSNTLNRHFRTNTLCFQAHVSDTGWRVQRRWTFAVTGPCFVTV